MESYEKIAVLRVHCHDTGHFSGVSTLVDLIVLIILTDPTNLFNIL